MEVVVTEEKKKIFRARKTMKISDRQQLEGLHTTLSTASSGLSNPSPPPLMNGTHKDDGPITGEKEQTNALESNSPNAASPDSPAPFLSLSLSPSPSSSQSPKAKEENPATPTSPFHSINFEMKTITEEEKDKNGPTSPSLNDPVSSTPTDSEESKEKDKVIEVDKKEEQKKTTPKTKDVVADSTKEPVKASASSSAQPPPISDRAEPVDTLNDTTETMDQETSTDTGKLEKLSVKSECSPMSSDGALKQEVKVNIKNDKDGDVKTPVREVMMEEKTKEEEMEVETTRKPSRPSSTPPSCTVAEETCSTSGLKRTLSEETKLDRNSVKREGKRPKMEFEAQLELKFSTKAGSHQKLEKIVQQLVEKHLKVLELTIFEKDFQELKERVDKIECASKHQTAINSLQAKIARLSKKFGEANQATENKKKQEALAAAANAAVSTAKMAPGANAQPQGSSRTAVVVKQTPTTASSSITAANPVSVPATALTSTSTALVPQTPLLHLINTTSNAASNNATGITTQSPTGTLVLKTAPGSSMMATAQPLLIQLPLSVANGQAGTLVNIPVSLSAAASLNKAKTTASTATFILKTATTTTTVPAIPAAASVPALQASSAQMSSGQISLARAVYQGGTGGISTPSAGVSVTTAKTPAQSVSVAGAVSSTSSPTTSGPAATGSTAPGPPQGTSLTTKTDNQATGTTSSKPAAARPKGSVIDLTEDDDDVQVTGVKSASVAVPSPTQRAPLVVGTLNSAGARSSPQSSFTSNPQLTVHHRPPLDTPLKARTVTSTTPSRGSTVTLPPLPVVPAPPRLPAEAERTSPPQQPQLKLVPGQNGIVLSWCVAETDRTCATVDSYHLYAYHQDNSNTNVGQQHWKKIGEVKALPLPMACTLTQFQSGSTYHFAVRAKDIYGRFGPFCEPQCTNVINSNSN